MANYSSSDAITLVNPFMKNAVSSVSTTIQANVCDMVRSMIWSYYPWNWSCAALTAIALVDGTQDYSIANANLYRLLRLRITRTDTTPDQYNDNVTILNWISLAPDLTVKMDPMSIVAAGYDPVLNKIRLQAAAAISSGVTAQIDGEYQIVPTKITSGTLGTALVEPDYYFNVFVTGLMWKFYQLTDDPRAKDKQADFYGELQQMAAAEDWGKAQQLHPSEPLGVQTTGNIGILQM